MNKKALVLAFALLLSLSITSSVKFVSYSQDEERTWIIYDNDNYTGYSSSGSPDYTGFQRAVLFTPPYTPCRITNISVYIAFYPADFRIHVTDSLHNDTISPILVTAANPTGWIYTPGYGAIATSDFFVSMEWLNPPGEQANPFLAYDVGPVLYQRSYIYFQSGTWVWQPINGCNYYIRVEVAPVKAETIYIKSDGSVVPSSAPISSIDRTTYNFTSNISYPTYKGIIVERSNIVIDGAGYTVRGNQSVTYAGLSLTGISNVTIRNTDIEGFAVGINLESSNNNIISGNNVTATIFGIYLYFSSNNNIVSRNNAIANSGCGIILGNTSNNNTVIGNNATANGSRGIYLEYSSNNNTIIGNNVTRNSEGIPLVSSSNNIINGNNVAANIWEGIGLYDGSSNNTIIGNNVTANGGDGISVVSSSNNTIYHNNAIGNGRQAYTQQSINAWNDVYPSGGNYWSDYTGVDLYSGPYQNETGSDAIGDTPYVIPYIIYSSDIDRYPLMVPWTAVTAAVRDIAVTNVTYYRTVVGQGSSTRINVRAANQGGYTETFNVTVYANSTEIETQTIINLPVDATQILTFNWNTSGFSKGNYTISAYAWPLPDEFDTADNIYTDNIITVTVIVGNLNNDGKVDILDIFLVANAFGSSPGSTRWNSNADVNEDGKVDIRDIFAVAREFGKIDP